MAVKLEEFASEIAQRAMDMCHDESSRSVLLVLVSIHTCALS